jgi:hypothetical protein
MRLIRCQSGKYALIPRAARSAATLRGPSQHFRWLFGAKAAAPRGRSLLAFVSVRSGLVVAAALLGPLAALAAHGTTPLKVVEEIEIDAPPSKVWVIISDFQGWNWLPGVAKTEGTGGNTPDQAKRKLIMNDGAVVEESLTKYDAERMSIGYHVDHVDLKTLPVTNYSAVITVRAAEGAKSMVEWKGRFYRGYPNAEPPPELSDDVATKAVTDLHKASLASLKARFESK